VTRAFDLFTLLTVICWWEFCSEKNDENFDFGAQGVGVGSWSSPVVSTGEIISPAMSRCLKEKLRFAAQEIIKVKQGRE